MVTEGFLARRWTIGLIVGAVVGLSVIGGVVAMVLGLFAVLLVGRERPRNGPVGGSLLGFGIAWITLFGSASARCGSGCTGPDLAPWFAIAGVSVLLGLVLTAQAAWTARADSR